MSTANMALVAKTQTTALSVMSEQELMGVLRNSLYPGASDESIKLVIGYCKAAGLDPMQKPVHIVPMDVKNSEGKYIKRDVIMPGIGLYRTQASRTNLCAGITEPEFGDVKRMHVKRKQYNNASKDDKSFIMVDDGEEVEFPEWCRVTVKRLVGNVVVDFTAKEFWLENYATSGKDSTSPNAMWKRRPYAQLAKCSEAQALRKAFPELGAAPTADEMEGKTIDDGIIEGSAVVKEVKPERKSLTIEELQKKFATDKIDADGVVTKFSPKSLIEQGEETAQNLIDFLSAKYILPAEVLDEINSWQGDAQ